MLMHNIQGDCNWAEGCHCTIDNPPSHCNRKPGGQGPPNAVGAHAFGHISAQATTKWDGLMNLQLAPEGAYNLTVPRDAGQLPQHFSHREEPKLLWSWSDVRGEYVASHLFNGTEAHVFLFLGYVV